jgi:hypothetical protein
MMEELFEFLFGANARINRAKCWRSVVLSWCSTCCAVCQLAKSAWFAGAQA